MAQHTEQPMSKRSYLYYIHLEYLIDFWEKNRLEQALK